MAATVLMVAPLSSAAPGHGDVAGTVHLLLADGRQPPASQAVVWIAGAASPASTAPPTRNRSRMGPDHSP